MRILRQGFINVTDSEFKFTLDIVVHVDRQEVGLPFTLLTEEKFYWKSQLCT